MAQPWALFVLSLHLCSAQRTCAHILLNGSWIELRPTLKVDQAYTAQVLMLLCWACAGYTLCVAKQGLGLQIAKSPPPSSGANCWPMRLLTTLPSPCRVYQQSLSPRQLISMLLAVLRVYTEKKVTIAPFPGYEEKLSGFLPVKPERHFRSWTAGEPTTLPMI